MRKINFLPPVPCGHLTKAGQKQDKAKTFLFPGATLHRENGLLTQGKVALGQHPGNPGNP
jgi:hypothetical protein